MSDGNAPKRFPPLVGEQLPERSRSITQEVIVAYAEASGDHNPIHLDPEYARKAGLPGTISHGLLTMGTACANVERWAGDGAWASRVSCRFSAAVMSGDRLSLTAQVTSADEASATLELGAQTSTGERALTKATVELRAL